MLSYVDEKELKRLFGDIEHDIKGILEEDEHFIPRL